MEWCLKNIDSNLKKEKQTQLETLPVFFSFPSYNTKKWLQIKITNKNAGATTSTNQHITFRKRFNKY